jgi:hypothetical protein
MAHKPHTMSEVYSHLHEEVEMRLDEAARVGYGFVLPASILMKMSKGSSTAEVLSEGYSTYSCADR